ncbi:MAG TPA: AI-2E family transporter [Longimicrobiales bacterium]|nr:AI-2E family transporter [Longimicrobiales bacterium]
MTGAEGESRVDRTRDETAMENAAAELAAGRFRRAFLLIFVVGISLLFLLVIRAFLLSVFLAALLAGLTFPLFEWLARKLGGRRRLAATLTIVIVIGGVGLPLAGFLVLVANEAVQVARGAQEWFAEQQPRLEELRAWLSRIPFVSNLFVEGQDVLARLGGIAERTGPLLAGTLAAATRGTMNFVLQLFVLFYSLYFFLVDGRALLRRILSYMPFSPEEETRLLERFVSVTRATLKGSILIGVLQGALVGLAFWATGLPAPAFWGTVSVVLAIIPAVGTALVWIPAVVFLLLQSKWIAALGLLLWCALVVGTVDNFLRPRLVGRDARMSDLLILLSTLGGIFLFGAIGFIAGPIVAALFVTVWHIYGEVFSDWLPRSIPAAPVPPPPGESGSPGDGHPGPAQDHDG